jgi:hypothetical protein
MRKACITTMSTTLGVSYENVPTRGIAHTPSHKFVRSLWRTLSSAASMRAFGTA